jgi:hypothetical protein
MQNPNKQTRKFFSNGNHWQITAIVGECFDGELQLTIKEIFRNSKALPLTVRNVDQAANLFKKDLL